MPCHGTGWYRLVLRASRLSGGKHDVYVPATTLRALNREHLFIALHHPGTAVVRGPTLLRLLSSSFLPGTAPKAIPGRKKSDHETANKVMLYRILFFIDKLVENKVRGFSNKRRGNITRTCRSNNISTPHHKMMAVCRSRCGTFTSHTHVRTRFCHSTRV